MSPYRTSAFAAEKPKMSYNVSRKILWFLCMANTAMVSYVYLHKTVVLEKQIQIQVPVNVPVPDPAVCHDVVFSHFINIDGTTCPHKNHRARISDKLDSAVPYILLCNCDRQ